MVSSNRNRGISSRTRRALLGSAALGASSLAAGCSGGGGDGGGDGTPTQTQTQTQSDGTDTGQGTPTQTTTEGPLPNVSGQTLTWPMWQNPEDVTFFGTGVFPGPQGRYAIARLTQPYQISMQHEARGPWVNNPIKTGDLHPEIYQSIDITAGEITVKLREDAKWSNGNPVKPGDALGVHLIFRLFFAEPHWDDVSDSPPIFNRAVTDYEIVSDTEYKFITKHDLFTNFTKQDIWADMVWDAYWGGIWQDTAITPYDEWWAAIEDWWQMAKEGEIDPWGGDWNVWNKSKELLFGDHGWSSDPEKNNYDYHWEQYFRDPENVATHGAWTLKSMEGTNGVRLKPNEHHYAVDSLNFDEIFCVARPSDRANRSALKANSQDYYRGSVPDYIVQSFPDDIEERQIAANGGLVFGFNHRHKLFSRRKARQALMYAIDTQRIARSVHRTKFDPVTVPGGHGYRTREILGDDYVDQTLIQYGRDLDRANQLMSEAGFSKEGGKWVDGEGNTLSIQIPTADTTPTLEPAFANQLSQFGIDASLQTYSQSVFSEKKDNGEFNIWPDNVGVGYAVKVGECWYLFGRRKDWNANWWRIYPDEQVEDVAWDGNRPETNRPSTWRPYVVEAPPVGEPDGDLQDYHVAELGMQVRFPSSEQQFAENLRTVNWVYNWYMPLLPIANSQTQHFFDTGHWLWPDSDAPEWNGVGVDVYQPENLLSFGRFMHANPDNPEEGASVEN